MLGEFNIILYIQLGQKLCLLTPFSEEAFPLESYNMQQVLAGLIFLVLQTLNFSLRQM